MYIYINIYIYVYVYIDIIRLCVSHKRYTVVV